MEHQTYSKERIIKHEAFTFQEIPYYYREYSDLRKSFLALVVVCGEDGLLSSLANRVDCSSDTEAITFLVGAFSLKEKSPTTTVGSFFSRRLFP